MMLQSSVRATSSEVVIGCTRAHRPRYDSCLDLKRSMNHCAQFDYSENSRQEVIKCSGKRGRQNEFWSVGLCSKACRKNEEGV